jgi:transposase
MEQALDGHGLIAQRHELVESRMRWKSHVRFGRRAGETDRWKQRPGAPVRSHLANSKLDECRRRVQNETMGHRGRKDDPLYRARRLLTKAHERLDDRGEDKLLGLLKAGDPRGEVRMAWHAKEVLRSIYDISDPETTAEFVAQLGHDLQDDDCPVEVHQLGRTVLRWNDQIAAWHQARFTNAPSEAANNLVKRVKRVKRIAFEFTNFANYRVRVLLYAGRPNW